MVPVFLVEQGIGAGQEIMGLAQGIRPHIAHFLDQGGLHGNAGRFPVLARQGGQILVTVFQQHMGDPGHPLVAQAGHGASSHGHFLIDPDENQDIPGIALIQVDFHHLAHPDAPVANLSLGIEAGDVIGADQQIIPGFLPLPAEPPEGKDSGRHQHQGKNTGGQGVGTVFHRNSSTRLERQPGPGCCEKNSE